MDFKRAIWLHAPSYSKFWILIPLLFTAFIQILTGIPKPDILRDANVNELLIQFSEELFDYPFWLQDLSHLPLFFVFAWLWIWFIRRIHQTGRTLFCSIIVTTSFAVFNELTQFYIPQRFPSAGDIIMNLSGVSLALILHSLLLKKKYKFQN